MRIVSFDDYLDLPRPRVNWIIDGLIPRPGFVMLMGPPKAGKSFLALDLGFQVARGGTFLGRPCSKEKVLYFQLDTSERVWRDRGLSLRQAGVDTSASGLGMVHPADEMRPLNMLLSGAQSYVRKALNEFDPALVILDTLREVHTEDENDSTCMKKVFDALESLFRGRAVVVVHHTNKIAADVTDPDPVRSARGSSYVTGKMDAYWLMYDGKLRIDSRFDEKQVHRLVQTPSGMFDFPDVKSWKEIQDNVAKLISDNPGASKNEIARLANSLHGYPRSTVYRVLAKPPVTVVAPQTPLTLGVEADQLPETVGARLLTTRGPNDPVSVTPPARVTPVQDG